MFAFACGAFFSTRVKLAEHPLGGLPGQVSWQSAHTCEEIAFEALEFFFCVRFVHT